MARLTVLYGVFALAGAPANAATLKTLYSFPASGGIGGAPSGQLVRDKAGILYGVTTNQYGGGGYVYRLVPPAGSGSWSATGLHEFTVGPIGYIPAPGLTADAAGNLYGATLANRYGENYGCGSVYKIGLADGVTAKSISHFNPTYRSIACTPAAPVNVSPDGEVFAITQNGGDRAGGFGAIVGLMPPIPNRDHWGQRLLYSFRGADDGIYPFTPMLLSASGTLYGTAIASPFVDDKFTPVFGLTPPSHGGKWRFHMVHRFSPGECSDSIGQLIEGPSGTLFGICQVELNRNGDGQGSVFSLTPPADGIKPWTYQLLYAFKGKADGGMPLEAVTLDARGNVYGTTEQGDGTIFKLTPPADGTGRWAETTLVTFNGTNGALPSSPLILTSAGTLIGTTFAGGGSGAGVMFEVVP